MERRTFIKNSSIFAAGATISPRHLFTQPPNPFILFLAELAEAIVIEVIVSTVADYIKKQFFDDDFREKINENNRPYTSSGMQIQPIVYQSGSLFYYPMASQQVNYYSGDMIVPFYQYNTAADNNRIIQLQKSESEQIGKLATFMHKVDKSPKINNARILLPKNEIVRNFSGNSKYFTEYENQESGRVLLQRYEHRPDCICTIESASYEVKNRKIPLQTIS